MVIRADDLGMQSFPHTLEILSLFVTSQFQKYLLKTVAWESGSVKVGSCVRVTSC